jgi:hypothetical protein
LIISMKRSGVATGSRGEDTATMSVRPPSGRYSLIAIPRGSGSQSGWVGSPAALEKRTVAGSAPLCMCAARVSGAAAGSGVKVALQTIPLAWSARAPA